MGMSSAQADDLQIEQLRFALVEGHRRAVLGQERKKGRSGVSQRGLVLREGQGKVPACTETFDPVFAVTGCIRQL